MEAQDHGGGKDESGYGNSWIAWFIVISTAINLAGAAVNRLTADQTRKRSEVQHQEIMGGFHALQITNDQLRADNAALKAEVAALKADLDRLRKQR